MPAVSPSVPGDEATRVEVADMLMTGIVTIPCAFGLIFAARAIISRWQGKPLQVFPGTPAETSQAMAYEWACAVVCILGVLYGTVRTA
jgi:hypothetical protein